MRIVKILMTLIAALTILVSCSPSNTKTLSTPQKIAVKANTLILIKPISNLSETESLTLIDWASAELKKDFSAIILSDYWKAEYNVRQIGIMLPSYNSLDSSTFDAIRKKTGIQLILLTNLDKVNENRSNEKNNPLYQTREAIVSMELLDLETKNIIWHSTTRVFANPLKANGVTQNYSMNVFSGNYAVNKAFKTSIKKLKKAIILTGDR